MGFTKKRLRYVLRSDAVLSGIAGALLSGVLSWILFAAPGGTQIPDSGSVADWLAAVGTWVIGYGAWRYAKEGHDQRISEYRERRATEAKARRAHLVATCAALGLAVGIKGSCDRYAALPDDERTFWQLQIHFDGFEDAAQPVLLSTETLVQLRTKDVTSFARINERLRSIRKLTAAFIAAHGREVDMGNNADGVEDPLFVAVSRAANEVHELCYAFKDAVL